MDGAAKNGSTTDVPIKPELAKAMLASDQLLSQFAAGYWTRADVNRNGMLEYNEVQAITELLFHRLGLQPEREETLRRVFTTLDVDKSNTFDMDEFTEFFRSCLRLQEASQQQGPPPTGAPKPPVAAAGVPAAPSIRPHETPSFGAGGTTGVGAAPYVAGEKVETYSRSHDKWMDAVVAEVADDAHDADGLHIPKGAVKVSWDNGTLFKWLHPSQFDTMLRRPGAGAAAAPTGQGKPAAVSAAAAALVFAAGDNVQVYSSSQNSWLDAVVQAAFPQGGLADGRHSVPPGTVKVVAGDYVKWVTPDQFAETLRKAQRPDAGGAAVAGAVAQDGRHAGAGPATTTVKIPGSTPKEKLAVLLKDKSLFDKVISTVFSAHADASSHMDPSKFAAGLKGVMAHIDPGRPFQEDRVQDIFRLADGNHSGAVSQQEFGQFVRHMLSDVHKTM